MIPTRRRFGKGTRNNRTGCRESRGVFSLPLRPGDRSVPFGAIVRKNLHDSTVVSYPEVPSRRDSNKMPTVSTAVEAPTARFDRSLGQAKRRPREDVSILRRAEGPPDWDAEKRLDRTGFQPLWKQPGLFLGRCPRLQWIAPLALDPPLFDLRFLSPAVHPVWLSPVDLGLEQLPERTLIIIQCRFWQ